MRFVPLFKLALPLACALGLLVGCPPRMPPFNATGTYAGAWSGTIETKATLNVTDCPLSLRLEQRPNLPIFRFHVVGLLTVNWGCLLPPEVLEFLALEPEDITLPILAVMEEDGSLALEVAIDTNTIPPELLALINLEAVGDVPLDTFLFSLDAQGTDSDEDGMMDALGGTLSLSATYEDGGTQSIGISGAFSVEVQN